MPMMMKDDQQSLSQQDLHPIRKRDQKATEKSQFHGKSEEDNVEYHRSRRGDRYWTDEEH